MTESFDSRLAAPPVRCGLGVKRTHPALRRGLARSWMGVRNHRKHGCSGPSEAGGSEHCNPVRPAGTHVSDQPMQARSLGALRAVALHPRGLRLTAYPSSMPALIELGYVEDRQARWEGARPGEMGRFLTPAGRESLKVLGSGEFG